MLSNHDLKRWIRFLEEQIVALDAAHLAATGKPHLASPELVAFMQMNDSLVRERVEQAISEFSANEAWPSWLGGDQIVNLTHRVNSARAILQATLTGQLKNVGVLKIPRAADRRRLIRWLLIDAWNMAGAAYLKGLTDSYLSPRA